MTAEFHITKDLLNKWCDAVKNTEHRAKGALKDEDGNTCDVGKLLDLIDPNAWEMVPVNKDGTVKIAQWNGLGWYGIANHFGIPHQVVWHIIVNSDIKRLSNKQRALNIKTLMRHFVLEDWD